MWPRFFGRIWLGAISGMGMASMVIASGIGPLVFGVSLSLFDRYAPLLWLSAAVPALLMAVSWWADNPQRFPEAAGEG